MLVTFSFTNLKEHNPQLALIIFPDNRMENSGKYIRSMNLQNIFRLSENKLVPIAIFDDI